MSRKFNEHHREFQKLAASINTAIKENNGTYGSTKERDEQQKLHVEKLYRLEKKFKGRLLSYSQTRDVYKKFIIFIKKTKGNILTAQPYFRESGKVFSKNISSAIKDEDIEELLKYDINAMLAIFIVENWEGDFPKRSTKSFEALLDVRRTLIENNLPLAINHAKIFFRKTPKNHLTLLDLIDICTYGLISGIDKYVGKYSKVWRSVCLGRMTGFMIEEYSKTFIRMYPSDKKVLYRANSLKHKLKIEFIGELAEAVNESFEKDKEQGKSYPKEQVTENQLIRLMNGSHYWSADTKPLKDGREDQMTETIYDYHPDDGPNPEEALIQKDLVDRMREATKALNLIEKKIIQLKGVEL